MPVPHEAYFGPAETGDGLKYGDVRELPEEERFRALKRRLDTLFIGQVNEIAKMEDDNKAPFPLFLMTCVGIEMLGKVFYMQKPSAGRGEDDIQKEGFLEVCNRIHPHFSRTLNKEIKKAYDHLWGIGEHEKVRPFSISHIIYRFGRNTMIHGYRGKGVYLHNGKKLEWEIYLGAPLLNPYWFWKSFVRCYNKLWDEFNANAEPTNPLRISAGLYLQDLLG